MIDKRTPLLAAGGLLLSATPALAADYEVTVTNLTYAIHFTPLIVAAHPESASVFVSGEPASDELRAIAEGGDTTALAALLESVEASVDVDDDLLAPGASRTFTVSNTGAPANTRLSLAGMLLPTNDGFVGLSSLALPSGGAAPEPGPAPEATPAAGDTPPVDVAGDDDIEPPPAPGEGDGADAPLDPFGETPPDGIAPDPAPAPVPGPVAVAPSITIDLVGYDAGTEANDELVGSGAVGEAGFPTPQPVLDTGVGTGGTGLSGTAEGIVHVHRGARGDDDPAGGASDLDASVHRWLNPVARVTVTVVPDAVR